MAFKLLKQSKFTVALHYRFIVECLNCLTELPKSDNHQNFLIKKNNCERILVKIECNEKGERANLNGDLSFKGIGNQIKCKMKFFGEK